MVDNYFNLLPTDNHVEDYYLDSCLQAHSSVAKACMLGAVRLHKVKSNDKEEMTGTALAKAIDSDVKKGLIPFYVCKSYIEIVCF